MAADELIHVTRWHNGEKTFSPFSDGEMARRRDAMQAQQAAIEAQIAQKSAEISRLQAEGVAAEHAWQQARQGKHQHRREA